MNTSHRFRAFALIAAIATQAPSLHAAAVVTHWGAPGYSVTTVRTTGTYVGSRPVACCYAGAVLTAAAVTSAAVTLATLPRSAPVIYATPAVAVYSAPLVYAPGTYYYVP